MTGIDRTVHLKAAGLAAGGAIVLLASAWMAGAPLARRAIDRLAPARLHDVNHGVIVQRAAVQTPHLLPLYGGSELVVPSSHRASEFFATAPTGFMVFAVGDVGTTPLITLEQLAPLVDQLKGRKVAVLITGYSFSMPDRLQHANYQYNVSRLQVGELMFGSKVGRSSQRTIAPLLLKERSSLVGDDFLRLGLEAAASGSTGAKLWRTAWTPLARVQNLVLRGIDAFRLVGSIAREPGLLEPVAADQQQLVWDSVIARADSEYRLEVAGHAFGFAAGPTIRLPAHLHGYSGGGGDGQFLDQLRRSSRWDEVAQLFRFLSGSGAEAIVINIPFSGPFMDYRGISADARQTYYRRLEALAAEYHVALRTFEDREYEPFFLRDSSHPSPKAWAVFDSTLDAFYHEAAR